MKRNAGWNTTRIIGAITLTMKQLGFSKEDIDLTVFGTIRIRQRFAIETIEKAGILWVSQIFPEEFFREMWNDDMGDVLQDLSDNFEIRYRRYKESVMRIFHGFSGVFQLFLRNLMICFRHKIRKICYSMIAGSRPSDRQAE